MKQVSIIGIGSPFNWDQIGWLIISELSKRNYAEQITKHHIKLVTCETPTSIALHADGADFLILIDGINEGLSAGEITKVKVISIADTDINFSSHGLGIKEMLAIIPNPPDETIIYGIGVNKNRFEISQPEKFVKEITDKLVTLLDKEIENFLLLRTEVIE